MLIYIWVIIYDYYNIQVHQFGFSFWRGRGEAVGEGYNYLKNQLNWCKLKFCRLFSYFLKSFISLKYYLADDIVPKGHLLVVKNYSKRKKMKKLSDRVVNCSRWFTKKKGTKMLPFPVAFYHFGLTQMDWHKECLSCAVTVNKCFFQSSINEWIEDFNKRFQQLARLL